MTKLVDTFYGMRQLPPLGSGMVKRQRHLTRRKLARVAVVMPQNERTTRPMSESPIKRKRIMHATKRKDPSMGQLPVPVQEGDRSAVRSTAVVQMFTPRAPARPRM